MGTLRGSYLSTTLSAEYLTIPEIGVTQTAVICVRAIQDSDQENCT